MKKFYRILIVEDSKITGKLLLQNLRKNFGENGEINLVENLHKAKQELEEKAYIEKSYEYIVLDLHLPDGEGTSLISWSSKLKGFRGKFIIFTASEDEKLREKLYTTGVLDFILKSGDISNISFEISELIKQVEKYNEYNILIVDDALFFRNMLKNIFLSRNYNVMMAKDGSEALNIIEVQKIDLIIMDYHMPVLDGRGFLEKRRKNPAIYQIPTIIVTGESDRNTISALLKLGANDVIQKPFIIEEIVTKVDNLIQILIFQAEKDNLTRELELNINKLNDINKKLSKYLSPQLHSSVFENKDLRIESKRKKLTIFFSDVQGFTETTEEMEPEDLTYILNSYLTEMSNIAIRHGATIDKFIGDAIVAFFGDPKSRGIKEDAVACVLMAIEMRDKLKELQTKWHNEGFVRPFNSRIGINTGYVTVGNFGSENKMEYTAIGGNMNLASRLESNSKAGEILISHETYLLVKDNIDCIFMGEIEVKGFHKPIPTYRVMKPLDRELLTAKTDGFFINVDYSHIKDREIILDILEDVKDRVMQLK